AEKNEGKIAPAENMHIRVVARETDDFLAGALGILHFTLVMLDALDFEEHVKAGCRIGGFLPDGVGPTQGGEGVLIFLDGASDAPLQHPLIGLHVGGGLANLSGGLEACPRALQVSLPHLQVTKRKQDMGGPIIELLLAKISEG